MDPIATARYGMMEAARRLAASADPVGRPGGDPCVDLAEEFVGQAQAGRQFRASAQIAGVADEMWRALIDVQTRKA